MGEGQYTLSRSHTLPTNKLMYYVTTTNVLRHHSVRFTITEARRTPLLPKSVDHVATIRVPDRNYWLKANYNGEKCTCTMKINGIDSHGFFQGFICFVFWLLAKGTSLPQGTAPVRASKYSTVGSLTVAWAVSVWQYKQLPWPVLPCGVMSVVVYLVVYLVVYCGIPSLCCCVLWYTSCVLCVLWCT